MVYFLYAKKALFSEEYSLHEKTEEITTIVDMLDSLKFIVFRVQKIRSKQGISDLVLLEKYKFLFTILVEKANKIILNSKGYFSSLFLGEFKA